MSKEQFYKYGESLGIKINDLQRLKMLAQEDMIKILEFEINKAFIHGQRNALNMDAGLERDEVKDYTNSKMRILNKKD